jgi:cob(I)alamin adenosyltransferase
MKNVHHGDEGFTYIMYGKKIAKEDLLMDLMGDIDELNSFIGLARSMIKNSDLVKKHHEIDEILKYIQELLFRVGRDLAIPIDKLKDPMTDEKDLKKIEEKIEEIWSKIPEPKFVFVYPTGSISSSILHIARAICRRAERKASKLYHENRIHKIYLIILNRLSDLLYVLARYVNVLEGVNEEIWSR